jgi:hypothetical protein
MSSRVRAVLPEVVHWRAMLRRPNSTYGLFHGPSQALHDTIIALRSEFASINRDKDVPHDSPGVCSFCNRPLEAKPEEQTDAWASTTTIGTHPECAGLPAMWAHMSRRHLESSHPLSAINDKATAKRQREVA